VKSTLRRLLPLVVGILWSIGLTAPLLVSAQTVTQGYNTDSDVVLQRGMVVGLKADDAEKVEPVNNSEPKRIHGVVVGTGDSSIVLSEEGQRVFVATSGKFEVLVSDQNGNVAEGDFISVSPVSGIAMRSDDTQEIILGKAIDAYDGNARKVSEAIIKDALGEDRKITIGRIQVDIAIARNPNLRSTASLPSFLREASQYIAGKPVNPIRVYISIVILFVTGCVAGALIYSGIRAGMIAIGRNPLSKKSIVRGMFQVVLVALIIFMAGIFGVYLLLRL
jgi:hypothetical protein